MSATQLSPSQLEEFLIAAYEIKEPVVVVGKPGVGKTAIYGQVAEKVGADFIRSHPALDDPTDGKGLPDFVGTGKTRRAEFVPIGQFEKVLHSTRPTIWLLDDFLMAPDSVQKTYMQWLHGRECAGHVLPDHVQIVIATNDRTHRAGVIGMLEPIKSRATIVELVENLEEWAVWLFGQTEIDGVKIPTEVAAETVAFLKFKSDLFCHFEPNVDLKNSPNPRTWVKSLKWFTRDLSPAVQLASIAGVVGEGAAAERMAFRQMYRELPTIEDILRDPSTGKIPNNLSVLYAVALALGSRASAKNFNKIAQYATRLEQASRGDFAALMIRDAMRRKPELQQTPEFVNLMSSPLGQLIGGGR